MRLAKTYLGAETDPANGQKPKEQKIREEKLKLQRQRAAKLREEKLKQQKQKEHRLREEKLKQQRQRVSKQKRPQS